MPLKEECGMQGIVTKERETEPGWYKPGEVMVK
jgi:hypothetical protein